MKTPCQRLLSLLLVFVLVLSLIPSVYAAVNDETTSTEPEATETTVSTESPTTTLPQSDSSEETGNSSAGAPDSQPDNEYGIATTASTSAGILLFDYADHGNYTTVLNSQVSVTYKPNGTGSAKTAYIKNLGWHFARYNNVAYADDPLYCIEPYKNYAASTSGNTGESLEGWEITIYSDKECTQKVTTVTTNADGKVGIYLDPGIYYARESGDTEGRFENEYWLVDESIKEFEILPHKDVDITFVNTQYGKIKVIKSMPSSGSLEGWTFIVRDINGDEIKGSPFITDASGLIVSENLYPGTYAVEEVIPDDSPYICVSENPQSVTVVQGRTAEVRFTNSLRSGKIAIRKVDTTGEPLAGAEFLLEWSVDGTSWLPVVYSNSGYAKEGTCSSEGLTDGRLISDKTGLVEFTGLHPERLYRLTETAAPDGFQLLADTAYEGGLPDDKEYTVDLTVVNVRTYELPETGSKSLVLMPIALILACSLCGAILFVTKRKKQ